MSDNLKQNPRWQVKRWAKFPQTPSAARCRQHRQAIEAGNNTQKCAFIDLHFAPSYRSLCVWTTAEERRDVCAPPARRRSSAQHPRSSTDFPLYLEILRVFMSFCQEMDRACLRSTREGVVENWKGTQRQPTKETKHSLWWLYIVHVVFLCKVNFYYHSLYSFERVVECQQVTQIFLLQLNSFISLKLRFYMNTHILSKEIVLVHKKEQEINSSN